MAPLAIERISHIELAIMVGEGDRPSGAKGPGGMVGLVARSAPECHDRITDIFVNHASFARDAFVYEGKMLIEQTRNFGRLEFF